MGQAANLGHRWAGALPNNHQWWVVPLAHAFEHMQLLDKGGRTPLTAPTCSHSIINARISRNFL